MCGNKMYTSGMVIILALLVGALGGCAKKKIDEPIDTSSSTSSSPPREEQTVGEELPDVSGDWIFEKDRGLEIIYFDYTSYALRADTLAALRRNADKIKQVPGVIIQIEGHCDERGTQEYNLALGEKRALATRSHLMNLGISGDRMITISYGEEAPVALGHDEDAWQQNRRSEFNRAM